MNFHFTLQGVAVSVHADKEGESRYMVRMAKVNSTFLRIGYLTGGRGTWVAERPGLKPVTQRFDTAEAACQALASWALDAGGKKCTS